MQSRCRYTNPKCQRGSALLSQCGKQNKEAKKRSSLLNYSLGKPRFGWPGRVRSTGRVAQRQEAAPCRLNSTQDERIAIELGTARPLVAARPDRPCRIRKGG